RSAREFPPPGPSRQWCRRRPPARDIRRSSRALGLVLAGDAHASRLRAGACTTLYRRSDRDRRGPLGGRGRARLGEAAAWRAANPDLGDGTARDGRRSATPSRSRTSGGVGRGGPRGDCPWPRRQWSAPLRHRRWGDRRGRCAGARRHRVAHRPPDRSGRTMDRESRRARTGIGAQIRQFRRGRLLSARLLRTVRRSNEMSEATEREAICSIGASIFARGLTAGSSGNISMRTEEGWLMTPTNASLGRLDPARLSKLDPAGRLISGDPPTKESFLHRVMYEERRDTGAVVHLHSTHSVAVSCLAEIDPEDVLPPITAYYVMRVGRLPLVPYFRPGDLDLAEAVRGFAGRHHAVLLANHGPVVAGASLDTAVNAIEELEETAKLYLLLRGAKTRYLTPAQVKELMQ